MNIDYIAHKGKKFTIEWYFDAYGKSNAFKYFIGLSVDRQKKLVKLFITMAEQGRIFNEQKFTHEGDQIYAFKPVPDRFLCFFFTGAKIIITNGYEKKSQKMPHGEKERAFRYKEDYVRRTGRGEYYE